jgi:hypothetical protein
MGRISQLFAASLAVLGAAASSAVLDLRPDNFDGMSSLFTIGMNSS